MQQDFVAQTRGVDVQIYLGGCYRLMAEHLLNGAQVGATFEQMCGETVAQGMWRHVFIDAGRGGQLLDNLENHDARQAAAEAVEENDVLAAGTRSGAVVAQVCPYVFHGIRRHRYESLLAALAMHYEEGIGGVQLTQRECAQLADTQPAAV